MRLRVRDHGLVCLASIALLGCPGDDSGSDDSPGSTAGSSDSGDGGSDGMQDTGDDGGSTGMDDGPGSTGMDDGPGSTGMDDDGSTGADESDGGSSSGGGATLPFTLDISGYDPHVGNDIHIKIFDGDDTELGSRDGTVDAAAGTYTIDSVVEDGGSYTVRWWVDFLDNDTCDPQPDDHMWEMTAQTADGSGLTISHSHDANWVDVCSFW